MSLSVLRCGPAFLPVQLSYTLHACAVCICVMYSMFAFCVSAYLALACRDEVTQLPRGFVCVILRVCVSECRGSIQGEIVNSG